MPVDAGTFIEPAFLQGCVCAHADYILSTIVQIFRNVVCLGCVSAWFVTEVESVDPHLRIAEDSVKLQPDMLSIILRRHGECLSVPAHACLGIFVSYSLVAMAMACFRSIWQIHNPVMRKVDVFPVG